MRQWLLTGPVRSPECQPEAVVQVGLGKPPAVLKAYLEKATFRPSHATYQSD